MTQPTQDPWGNNQQPPTPSQPTPQPYVFPQPGYGPQPQPPVYPQQQQPPPVYYQQPGYPQQPQQQPGLWNPSGVYGGVPEPKKQWPWWATAIFAITVVVVLAAVGSVMQRNSTTTTGQQVIATAAPAVPTQRAVKAAQTTATALNMGRVGETVALNGYTITVNGVEKSVNFDTSSEIGKAKPGNIMVAVDITVGSNKNQDVSSNALFTSLKDSQGFKYNMAIFGSKDPGLPGENDIPAGDKVRGWVTFEVPETATGFVLEYGQMFESEKIRIALS
jgi:hypothetical protein